jgi:hypothetical protein
MHGSLFSGVVSGADPRSNGAKTASFGLDP